jgi:hypothetical protein
MGFDVVRELFLCDFIMILDVLLLRAAVIESVADIFLHDLAWATCDLHRAATMSESIFFPDDYLV